MEHRKIWLYGGGFIVVLFVLYLFEKATSQAATTNAILSARANNLTSASNPAVLALQGLSKLFGGVSGTPAPGAAGTSAGNGPGVTTGPLPPGSSIAAVAIPGTIETSPETVPNDLAAPVFTDSLENPLVASPTPLTDSSASVDLMNFSPDVQSLADEASLNSFMVQD